jgi:hypothetical protein
VRREKIKRKEISEVKDKGAGGVVTGAAERESLRLGWYPQMMGKFG